MAVTLKSGSLGSNAMLPYLSTPRGTDTTTHGAEYIMPLLSVTDDLCFETDVSSTMVVTFAVIPWANIIAYLLSYFVLVFFFILIVVARACSSSVRTSPVVLFTIIALKP